MHLTTRSASSAIRARRPSARLAVVAVVVGLLTVFVVDRATDRTPFQHLYYVPIIIAGLTLEVTGGLAAAAGAIVLYHLANPHLRSFAYEESDIVQVALFLLVGLVTATLTRERNRLRELASTDDLTGLRNLRAFEVVLRQFLRDARERHQPLAMLVLDVDRLKGLNDQFGHLTGAEAVRAVGHFIAQHLPPGAVACRYGGDEFAVALPSCSLVEARRVADRLRLDVRSAAPTLAGRSFPNGSLSVSVGVACWAFDADNVAPVSSLPEADLGEALFREADAALYKAKAGGRNRVCISIAKHNDSFSRATDRAAISLSYRSADVSAELEASRSHKTGVERS